MSVMSAYMYVYYVSAWYLQKPEGNCRSLGTGITEGREHHGYWELSLGPLQDLLSAEPSL